MRKLAYISGVVGSLLVLLRFSGFIIPFFDSMLWLLLGLGILILVFLPAVFLDIRQHDEKIRRIIKSYREKPETKVKDRGEENRTRGWSMNNSPFRTRKSGLTWGGGNVHAANAQRGTRRRFRG